MRGCSRGLGGLGGMRGCSQGGRMRGCSRGACVTAPGGCAWFFR